MKIEERVMVRVDYDCKALGKAISQRRLDAGLSQEVLSGLAGIRRSQLSLIETGSTSVTLDTLWHIAEALSVPLSLIIQEIEAK